MLCYNSTTYTAGVGYEGDTCNFEVNVMNSVITLGLVLGRVVVSPHVRWAMCVCQWVSIICVYGTVYNYEVP